MKILDELLFQVSIQLEKGLELFVTEVLTVEGLIAMFVMFFIASLVIQIRS